MHCLNTVLLSAHAVVGDEGTSCYTSYEQCCSADDVHDYNTRLNT